MVRFGVALASAVALSGCAIHPLPENVTGLPTNAIVNHIRCEARYAFGTAIGRYLAQSSPAGSYAATAAPQLIDRSLDISELRYSVLTPSQQNNISKYYATAIAYDFTFDMTEQNTASTLVNFGSIFTRGSLAVAVGGSNDRQRQTIRNFRVSDTFAELVRPTEFCTKYSATENFSYPITGQIGLAEMIMTFVDLNEFQRLRPAKDAKDNAPTLADTLVFQTTLTGSVGPKVTLSPLKAGSGLSDASLSLSGSRKDNHKVIVALSLPPTKGARGACSQAGLLLAGPSVSSFRRSPAEVCALAEVETQVQRNIITNLSGRQAF